ncbi:Uncharacterised protein [Vibrio cholerae]|nr:Uncharacterised protein [Vibrio cholerae]
MVNVKLQAPTAQFSKGCKRVERVSLCRTVAD